LGATLAGESPHRAERETPDATLDTSRAET
jgi:hypothetical protein